MIVDLIVNKDITVRVNLDIDVTGMSQKEISSIATRKLVNALFDKVLEVKEK